MPKKEHKKSNLPKTKITDKSRKGDSWSGVVQRYNSNVNVEVNSISNLLARCAKASG